MATLILPLVVLGSLAAYVAGVGGAAWWANLSGGAPPLLAACTAAGALHLAWISATVFRRAPLLVWPALLTSIWLCRRGLATFQGGEPGWWPAALLETLALLVALAMRDPEPLAQRLARWRRARDEIALQLRMADGLLPWVRESAGRLFWGRAELPVCRTFRRLAGELADLDDRLGGKVSGLAAPEQLRQLVHSAASQLLARAQEARSALAVELERRTLALAAAFREQCEALPGLTAEERSRASRQCEELLLDLMRDR